MTTALIGSLAGEQQRMQMSTSLAAECAAPNPLAALRPVITATRFPVAFLSCGKCCRLVVVVAVVVVSFLFLFSGCYVDRDDYGNETPMQPARSSSLLIFIPAGMSQRKGATAWRLLRR